MNFIDADVIVDEEFVVGFRLQTEWAWLITAAFFMGALGAGIFLLSLAFEHTLGTVIGLLIAAVGKSAAHLLYLGRPERFWRIISRPGSSWISRGLVAIIVLVVFAILHIVLSTGLISALAPMAGTPLHQGITAVAGLAALVVMVYDGFVMSYSPAIPLWNTALLPVLFGGYGLMGGSTALLFLDELGLGRARRGSDLLHPVELLLISINLLILLTYLAATFYSTAAAKRSILLLIRERYRAPFLGGVIFVGLILTSFFSLYLATSGSVYLLFGLAVAELVGDFLLITLLLRAGVFAPLLPRWGY